MKVCFFCVAQVEPSGWYRFARSPYGHNNNRGIFCRVGIPNQLSKVGNKADLDVHEQSELYLTVWQSLCVLHEYKIGYRHLL